MWQNGVRINQTLHRQTQTTVNKPLSRRIQTMSKLAFNVYGGKSNKTKEVVV